MKSGEIKRQTADGQIIVNHSYEIDQFMRRVTLPREVSSDNYLAFLGCSFAFGFGVRDEETIPSQIQKNLMKIKVYNYGVSGAGPIDVLFRLKSIEPAELPEKKGVFLYFFFKDQMKRLFHHPEFVANSDGMNVVYSKDAKGEWTFTGFYKFINPYRTWFYQKFIHSSFYRLVAPVLSQPAYEEEDWRQLVDVILAMKKEVVRLNGKFVFVIWPYIELDSKLVEILRENQVDVLDYSHLDIFKLTNQKVYIPGDGHPTPAAAAVMGKQIAADLPSVISLP
ncbi:MAG: hypothetical protein V4598_13995 [Bdellovibrionota bacterium]